MIVKTVSGCRASLSILVFAAAGALLTSCSGGQSAVGPPDPARALETNRRLWTGRGITNYRFTFRSFSFLSAPDGSRPVLIEVRNGSRASATFADTGVPASPDTLAGFDTVEALFGVIQNALNDENGAASATYDPTLGYPSRINVDPDRDQPDDGYTYQISDFERVARSGP